MAPERERKNVYDALVFTDSLRDSADRLRKMGRRGTDPEPETPAVPTEEDPRVRWMGVQGIANLKSYLETPKAIGFTELQASCLVYLLLQQKPITRTLLVAEAVGGTEGTAYQLIRRMVANGSIEAVNRFRHGQFQGMKFRLNDAACAPLREFLEANPRIRNPHEKLLAHLPAPTWNESAKTPAVAERAKPSESIPDNDGEIANTPELGWWASHDVGPDVIRRWSYEFGVPVVELVTYLQYAWYYVNYSGAEVPKPKAYFYKAMERNHRFDKPDGFRSLRTMEAEAVEAQSAQFEAELKKLQAARLARDRAKLELLAERLLAKEGSPLFDSVLARFSAGPFRPKPGSAAFQGTFLDALRQIVDEEGWPEGV